MVARGSGRTGRMVRFTGRNPHTRGDGYLYDGEGLQHPHPPSDGKHGYPPQASKTVQISAIGLPASSRSNSSGIEPCPTSPIRPTTWVRSPTRHGSRPNSHHPGRTHDNPTILICCRPIEIKLIGIYASGIDRPSIDAPTINENGSAQPGFSQNLGILGPLRQMLRLKMCISLDHGVGVPSSEFLYHVDRRPGLNMPRPPTCV